MKTIKMSDRQARALRGALATYVENNDAYHDEPGGDAHRALEFIAVRNLLARLENDAARDGAKYPSHYVGMSVVQIDGSPTYRGHFGTVTEAMLDEKGNIQCRIQPLVGEAWWCPAAWLRAVGGAS